ncbi:MAG: DUF2059 domain-containing protein [Pseudomonadota bacterium]
MKLLTATLVCSLLALATSAAAAEPNRPVFELFEVTNMADMTAQINNQMQQQVKLMITQQLAGTDVPAEVDEIINRYLSDLTELTFSRMDWEKMKLKYAAIYESVLTNQEILDLVTFYQSDLGQVVLSKMPLLMQEAMVVGQQEMQAMMPQIQQLMSGMQQEIEAAVKEAAN